MSLLEVAANLVKCVIFPEDNERLLSELTSDGVRLRDRIQKLEGSEKELRLQVDNAVSQVESRVLDLLTLALALTGSQETIDVNEMLLRVESLKGESKRLTEKNERLQEDVRSLSKELEDLKDRKSVDKALDVLKTRTMKVRGQKPSPKPKAPRGKGKK